ncbi:MAG TPA: hypothetical protein VIT90_16080 [Lysobacter sp.]
MATDKQSGASGTTLEARIAVLEELFVRLAQTGAAECILDNGFKSISERLDHIANQMAPLRALGPDVANHSVEDNLRIERLKAALVSPDPKDVSITREESDAGRFQMRSRS